MLSTLVVFGLSLLLLPVTLDAHPIKLAHRTIASAQRAKRGTFDIDLEAGIYVLQFKQRIDTVGMRRLIGVLGYEPDDYVPKHGLLIYVNGSEQALALQRALDTRLARLFKLIASDRQANIGSQLHRTTTAAGRRQDRFVIYRNGTRTGQAVRHDVPRDPNTVVLRAHIIGLSAENIRDTIDIGELENFVGNFSRTRPTARFPNHEVLILRNVHREDAAAVADALVRRFPYVAFVELRAPFKLMNRWSVPSIQRASQSLQARTADWKPLGTGRGQIVSISDTGVATTQCFFSDGLGARAGAVPRSSSTTSIPPDTGHPKFRAYTSGVGGDFDDSNGHGTHTTGTLAGRAAAGSGTALFNGVASDSRLCFFDLLGPSGDDALAVPDDLGVIFQWSADCGAYIHSGSWGAENYGVYTADERAADLFTWRNRFFLAVFAAGNSGPGRATVGAPGCAKNVLTIGAVMNGIDAMQMAVRSAPFGAAVYNNTRIGDFSSRGDFEARSAAKVDLVADGGAYVWSAAFDAPKSGSCESSSECVLGLEGTSMATPAAAGAAVLLREWLLANVQLETLPTASLMRAMLIASAQPTDGPFPMTKPYASYADRRNAEGFGRIVLDQILGANMRIVSNERGQFGLARAGDIIRFCVAIDGLSPLTGVLKDSTDLVVVLSYADYPSAIGLAQSDLVNDLDLVVRTATNSTPVSVNGLPAGTRETLLTNERVLLKSPRAVDISVVASSIDFAGPQTFSLIVALRGPNASRYKLLVSTPQLLHGETQSPCSLCGTTQFLAKADCIVCGDGIINAPLEQCEPVLSGSECCNATSCRWSARSTLCATQIGGCLAQGRCTPDQPTSANSSMSCTPSTDLAYRIKRVPNKITGKIDTLCESSSSSSSPVSGTPLEVVAAPSANVSLDAVASPACGHSIAYWVAQLRNNASAYASDDDRLCCARFSAYAEQRTAPEPLYHQLALAYIAAHLNAETHISSEQLVALRTTQLLLERQCGTSAFTSLQDREDALEAITRLETLALPVCADERHVPPDSCAAGPTRGTETSEALCNGPPNRYVDSERRCACGAMYHIGEPDCRDLACSGNGASVYNYATRLPTCVCLPGWTGVACNRCAEAPSGARYMCIGVPQSLVVAQHTHVLLMVDAASVTARLDGSYYPSGVAKEADGLPGTPPLDCACRRAVNRVLPTNFETHLETLEASMEEIEEQTTLWAHASVLLHPRPTTQALGSGGAPKQLTSDAQPRRAASSTAGRLEALALPAALLLLLLFE